MSAMEPMTDQVISPPAPAPQRTKRKFTLDDLLGDTRPQAVGVTELPTAKEIRIERILADPDQPRQTFDPEKLEELAASIQLEGVLQPIVVRYDDGRDTYVVVHGERRWRACQLAGLATIPAIVRDVPAERRLIHQLMENIVRDDLNAVDRATALRALKQQLPAAGWDDVAAAVGIRRSRLFQLLGTTQLPDAIQADIRAGRISEKQSRALQGLPTEQQRALRDVLIGEALSADLAMQIARRLKKEQVPDDLDAAASAIGRIRRELERPSTKLPIVNSDDDPELDALLTAIAKIAHEGKPAKVSLRRLADWNGFEPYERDRLLDEVYAIGQSLARMAESDERDAAIMQSLSQLRTAIDAVVGS
ncbi:MAG TPA: ParB/RepB/Spo0J family partition protein [Thermomicrobiales bacterium]|nr:ParB/RepB/Spo0J family partition protein [Thermomicrobiales bacterium]HRA47624.1 ParB/RepB/Spo0J family partition protein [Thermomicrobiales bacterium]